LRPPCKHTSQVDDGDLKQDSIFEDKKPSFAHQVKQQQSISIGNSLDISKLDQPSFAQQSKWSAANDFPTD
jgi:hypothetical protein